MRNRWLDVVIFLLVAVSIGVSIVTLRRVCHSGGTEDEVAAAITKLQPRWQGEEARELAIHFIDVAESFDENPFDPLLLVSIARKESSLMPNVTGQAGEEGMMQCHGIALRFMPEGCTMKNVRCQIATGTGFLNYVRDKCSGSTWRLIASYGARKCVSEDDARKSRSALNAKRYYDQVGGTEWID